MKKLTLFTLALIFAVSACAEKSGGEINTHKVGKADNIAIMGYDPVAYFTVGKAIKGSPRYYHEWNDAIWLFASENNRNLFAEQPEKYAPQYGGYCAYGVAVPKQKIEIDPRAWHIHNGKLYLNYTPNTQDVWLRSKEQYIEDADKNWPDVKND
jgi:YHS domain-containing protein